jgi:hypothetical protein
MKSIINYWKKYSKLKQRVIIVLGLIILLAGMAAIPYITYHLIVRYDLYRHPTFQIAALIEIGLALLAVRIPERRLHLRGITWAVGLVAPILIASNIEALRPVAPAGWVFLLALGAALTFQWYHSKRSVAGKKSQIREKIVPSQVSILPTYLPSGFKEAEVENHRRKGYSEVEMIYDRDDSEYLIWIKQASRPIPDSKPLKNMQITERIIKGVLVQTAQETAQPPSRGKQQDEPLFIEANWSNNGLHFNLRSDGISLLEAEKIIASMIQ